PERLAARAHPLQPVRARLHAAARDADVLPGRPAVLPGSDLQLRARRARATADDQRVRLREHGGLVGARLQVGHHPAPDAGGRSVRTPSQTVGPFFEICLTKWANGPDAGGVRIGGYVIDGAGDPVPDAMIETWDGERFARSGTDDDGRYEVRTPKVPYIDVSV